MDAKERIKEITEFWFLTDPLLFAAYCTHELYQNDILEKKDMSIIENEYVEMLVFTAMTKNK